MTPLRWAARHNHTPHASKTDSKVGRESAGQVFPGQLTKKTKAPSLG